MLRSHLRFQRFSYSFKELQLKWKQNSSSVSNSTNNKFYCLAQFPYPSGSIHLGHARVYFISDTIAKYKTLRGFNVLHPMGWDSFGLPAENAAIQRNISPKTWTQNNINEMKDQLIALGITLDWNRQIATHTIQYYKWTQHLFVLMFNRGLAYKKQSEVNWDPVDKTVLANQQVDSNGMSWRSGAKVEKKVLNQWFLKITDYAERLVDGLNELDWPSKVKQMQKGWIGLKKGFIVNFQIKQNVQLEKHKSKIEVFIEDLNDLQFCRLVTIPSQSQNHTKVGTCINPVTLQQIPIIQIKSPIYQKVQGFAGLPQKEPKILEICKSFSINVQTTPRKVKQVNEIMYREAKIMLLKDWLVSRQRYWGAPIPTINCEKCGCVPSSLPVALPQINSLKQNPLTLDSFTRCKCPKCSGDAVRESDTLDTFVDSSWYYLRYLNPHNNESMTDPQENKWMEVDVYIGGIQHAIMHLLYARFVYKVLYDQGLVQQQQPFYRLIDQGLVKGKTFRLKDNNRYITQQEATQKYNSQEIIQTFQKMSKSKYNGISPISLTNKYGSDALRLALLSVPYDKDIDFTQTDVKHKLQFIIKVYNFADKVQKYSLETNKKDDEMITKVNRLLNDMQSSMEKYNLHVYQARVMELFNVLKQALESKIDKNILLEIYRVFVLTLYPICPYLSKQLMSKLSSSIKFEQKWPQLTQNDSLEAKLLLSINGKFVKELKVDKSIVSETDQLIKIIKQDPQLNKKITSQIKQIITKQTKIGFVINLLL